jgi:hypothetical protein
MKNSKAFDSFRQFIIKKFFGFLDRFHCGELTEGVRLLAGELGRRMIFSRGGRLELCTTYTAPSWSNLLKSLKGKKGRYWRDRWYDEEREKPKPGFWSAGVPELVARNITPGKEGAGGLLGLVRVNRGQKAGNWRSNLYQFDPAFLEWLACSKRIPVELINDLVSWINLQNDANKEWIFQAVKQRKEEAAAAPVEEVELEPAAVEVEPVEELPAVELEPKKEAEKLEPADRLNLQDQKILSYATDSRKIESTFSYEKGNIEYTDIEYLGDNSPAAVENWGAVNEESTKGRESFDAKSIPAEITNDLATSNLQKSSEAPYHQDQLESLERGASLRLKQEGSGFQDIYYVNSLPTSKAPAPVLVGGSSSDRIADKDLSWLKKLGCSGLAAVCKSWNEKKEVAAAGAAAAWRSEGEEQLYQEKGGAYGLPLVDPAGIIAGTNKKQGGEK